MVTKYYYCAECGSEYHREPDERCCLTSLDVWYKCEVCEDGYDNREDALHCEEHDCEVVAAAEEIGLIGGKHER